MSITIEGMDKPQYCSDCIFCNLSCYEPNSLKRVIFSCYFDRFLRDTADILGKEGTLEEAKKSIEHFVSPHCPIKGNLGKLEEISPIWQTGTPNQKGWYLLKQVDEDGNVTYDSNYLKKGLRGDLEWKFAYLGEYIGWQKIGVDE